jgi:hypothetical protein
LPHNQKQRPRRSLDSIRFDSAAAVGGHSTGGVSEGLD